MATAITQSVLARVYPRIEPEHPVRGRAVIAGVQGEMHQVGAQMVADLLEADGWDVRFLGANAPHDGVVRSVEEHGAELFGVSCTMLFNVTRVDDLFEAARRSLGSRAPRLLAGGGAFRHSPGLGHELGADGVARDLRDAVALARVLAPGT
jgi:methanogenic corrinoid protein MtbC1